MIAGVITVPSRREALKRLLNVVEREIGDVTIFVDEKHQGHKWNYSRMFRIMLPKAPVNEPVLLLTDDAITIPGWYERWLQIHEEAQSELYTLFGRQHHLFKQENLDRGYVTKVQGRGWYDQASIFINQQTLPQRVDDWFTLEGGLEWMNAERKMSSQHFDLRIQAFLVSHRIPWTITTPSLFDHQDIPSISGNPTIKGSPAFIGHPRLGRAEHGMRGIRLAEWRQGKREH